MVLLANPATAPAQEAAAPGGDLTRMSLSELANLDVISVSKSSEPVQRAPATIYVITHEDILRSGATSVPEALRLAPNLLITQTSSSAYTISARGLGGNPAAQNFSNKLLILIDGRSVYTPLFSGIYSDTLDVLLEDIDRIEVISGVGATLWGANAMNGVINIITRPSYRTQGTYVEAGAGNQEQLGAARYGGRLGTDTTVRVYGFDFHRGAMELPDGSTAHDGWNKGQGGFRGDWSTDQDTLTAQGDVYRGTEQVIDNSDGLIAGGNLLARYQHRAAHSELQVQAYFDQTERFGAGGNGGFVVQTYDLQLQQSIDAGTSHRIVWGGGERVYKYGITNTASLLFEPPDHALTLADAFVQDTMKLADQAALVMGVKLEDDPFAGWTPLPDVRLSIGMGEHAALWAAASRAIRSPTPFDDEVVEKLGAVTELAANPGFRPEEVTGYEAGARSQPTPKVSLSAAIFCDVYDDLRTIELAPQPPYLPLYWGNLMRGDISGVDAWANFQVLDWWRLSPGFTWTRERLSFKSGASRILGLAQAGDDPSSHASLVSSMNLPRHTSFDATLRYVGALPDPALPHYYEMDARFGWQASPALDLSLSGANLLHARHYESPPPYGEQITRSVIAGVRWKF